MIFRLEAVPEQTVRRYFLQVKKLTFKRAPGSRYAFPTHRVGFLIKTVLNLNLVDLLFVI
jgi:hypothetical protein